MNLGRGEGGTWHPQLGRIGYKVHSMSYDPDDQVRQTLGVMREKVAEDSSNPLFISRVRRMFDVQMYPGLRGYGAGRGVVPGTEDEIELVKKVWSHTRNGIKFQRDEVTGDGIAGLPQDEVVETIIRPLEMAGYMDSGKAVGDCDDFSMYAACCLKALGIPCSFATTAADAKDPGQFSHVYVVAYPKDPYTGRRVRMPVDSSHGEYAGWETAGYGRYQEWPVWDRMNWLIGNAVTSAIVVAGVYFLFKNLVGRLV